MRIWNMACKHPTNSATIYFRYKVRTGMRGLPEKEVHLELVINTLEAIERYEGGGGAVVGAGLSGLAAAHELARSGRVRVTLYEKEDYLGGAKTVAVDSGGGTSRALVDLGFMVFNPLRKNNA
ncbi:hypothetical protein PR202_gb29310 [Eleusine coracana subsp. coracana]|uniref:Amine oxidase domain-containing protein n=1 Tax=Eleusine coracana subsp. coracana TaxID=191504 RepID=A0AAV5FYM4_ELECO|nr:hypothetical protein PR202_gb29310 [Eleusine coracana subsp. coracana]